MLGEHVPIDALLKALSDPTKDLRLQAMRVAGRLGERIPLELLLDILHDEDWQMRRAAVEELGATKFHAAVEPLVCALSDDYRESDTKRFPVRDAALAALQRLAPERLVAALPEITQLIVEGVPTVTPNSLLGANMVRIIAKDIAEAPQCFPSFIAFLGSLLDWPHATVRCDAARALGKVRRNIPNHIKSRLYALRQLPEPICVRLAADDALAEILSVEDSAIEDEES